MRIERRLAAAGGTGGGGSGTHLTVMSRSSAKPNPMM